MLHVTVRCITSHYIPAAPGATEAAMVGSSVRVSAHWRAWGRASRNVGIALRTIRMKSRTEDLKLTPLCGMISKKNEKCASLNVTD